MLSEIPYDILITHIVPYLSLLDKYSLINTCKIFNDISSDILNLQKIKRSYVSLINYKQKSKVYNENEHKYSVIYGPIYKQYMDILTFIQFFDILNNKIINRPSIYHHLMSYVFVYNYKVIIMDNCNFIIKANEKDIQLLIDVMHNSLVEFYKIWVNNFYIKSEIIHLLYKNKKILLKLGYNTSSKNLYIVNDETRNRIINKIMKYKFIFKKIISRDDYYDTLSITLEDGITIQIDKTCFISIINCNKEKYKTLIAYQLICELYD